MVDLDTIKAGDKFDYDFISNIEFIGFDEKHVILKDSQDQIQRVYKDLFVNHAKLIASKKIKYVIQDKLTEALNLIEQAIEEEPEYVGDFGYNGVQGYIEHALDVLSFPIHD